MLMLFGVQLQSDEAVIFGSEIDRETTGVSAITTRDLLLVVPSGQLFGGHFVK